MLLIKIKNFKEFQKKVAMVYFIIIKIHEPQMATK